jgi:hypothetical protein
LCTFDFIQYNFALFISSLFLFHFYIHFHLYILTYTYPFNLQSQKRIKKFFTVGFVGNSGSFFLFLFAGEVDSIGIFKIWTGLTRLWIIFLVLGQKKNSNPHEPVPISVTRGPAGWPFTMQVADLDFQTRSLRGGLWETCKFGPIRPAPTPNWTYGYSGFERCINIFLQEAVKTVSEEIIFRVLLLYAFKKWVLFF